MIIIHLIALFIAKNQPNMYNNDNSNVLTVPELAKELRICTNTAYALVRSGQIRHVKIGRVYRVPRSAVDEYLNRQTQ